MYRYRGNESESVQLRRFESCYTVHITEESVRFSDGSRARCAAMRPRVCGPEPTLRPYRAERGGEVQHGDGDDHSLQQHRQQQQDPELRTGARHDIAAVRHPTNVSSPLPDFQKRLKQWQRERSPQVIPSPQPGEEEEAGPENKSSFPLLSFPPEDFIVSFLRWKNTDRPSLL